MSQPVFRFAPTPNGYLHLGHAYSALLNQKMARDVGGRLLLRMEDTDVTRMRPEFMSAIFEDLHWLGLTWEEPVRIQSQHFAIYEAALHRLWDEGSVFPCFCSRKAVAANARAPMNPDGQHHYGGPCKMMPRSQAKHVIEGGVAYGWRFKTEGTAAADWGDVMIAKPKTGSWYHIAVVVDDAAQGVTHVVRGMDVEPSTRLHQQLQARLGLPTPTYHHHDLVLDEHGQKLSKRLQSVSLRALRQTGMTRDDIVAKLFDKPTA